MQLRYFRFFLLTLFSMTVLLGGIFAQDTNIHQTGGIQFDYPAGWTLLDDMPDTLAIVTDNPESWDEYQTTGLTLPGTVVATISTAGDFSQFNGLSTLDDDASATLIAYLDLFRDLVIEDIAPVDDIDAVRARIDLFGVQNDLYALARGDVQLIVSVLSDDLAAHQDAVQLIVGSITEVAGAGGSAVNVGAPAFPPEWTPIAEVAPREGYYLGLRTYPDCPENSAIPTGIYLNSPRLETDDGQRELVLGITSRSTFTLSEPGVYTSETTDGSWQWRLEVLGEDQFIYRVQREGSCTTLDYFAYLPYELAEDTLISDVTLPDRNQQYTWRTERTGCPDNNTVNQRDAFVDLRLADGGNVLMEAFSTQGDDPALNRPRPAVYYYANTGETGVYVRTTNSATITLTLGNDGSYERVTELAEGCRSIHTFTPTGEIVEAESVETGPVEIALTDLLTFDTDRVIAHPLDWAIDTDNMASGLVEMGNSGAALSSFSATEPGSARIAIYFDDGLLARYAGYDQGLLDTMTPTDLLAVVLERGEGLYDIRAIGDPVETTVGPYIGLMQEAVSSRNDDMRYMLYVLDAGNNEKLFISARVTFADFDRFLPALQEIVMSLDNEAVLSQIEVVEIGEPTFNVTLDDSSSLTPANDGYISIISEYGSPYVGFITNGGNLALPDSDETLVFVAFDDTSSSGTYPLNIGGVPQSDTDINYMGVTFGIDIDDTFHLISYLAETGTLELENISERALTGTFEFTGTFRVAVNASDFNLMYENTLGLPDTVTISGTFENIPIPR
ncbi:MAG: hypothetical protein RIC84_04585 [Aggregatilineales bacterium]